MTAFPGCPLAPPPNYLPWSIVTTLLCCLPAGIVSIVYAAQVNTKYQAGDVTGALAASANARRWAVIAAVAGVAVGILYVLVMVGLGLFSTMLSTGY